MSLTNKRADSLENEVSVVNDKLKAVNFKLNRTQAKLDTVVKYGKICFEVITTYERKGLKKVRQVRTVEIACPD